MRARIPATLADVCRDHHPLLWKPRASKQNHCGPVGYNRQFKLLIMLQNKIILYIFWCGTYYAAALFGIFQNLCPTLFLLRWGLLQCLRFTAGGRRCGVLQAWSLSTVLICLFKRLRRKRPNQSMSKVNVFFIVICIIFLAFWVTLLKTNPEQWDSKSSCNLYFHWNFLKHLEHIRIYYHYFSSPVLVMMKNCCI